MLPERLATTDAQDGPAVASSLVVTHILVDGGAVVDQLECVFSIAGHGCLVVAERNGGFDVPWMADWRW